MAVTDPFDDLLGLEDEFYEQGFKQGRADGLRQSRIEARIFGIEKGFEKFVEMGKLQARLHGWQRKLGDTNNGQGRSSTDIRLKKHLDTLAMLVDPQTLSLANEDDAVAEFDDRLKRAHAKVVLIERLLGEQAQSKPKSSDGSTHPGRSTNIEDFGL